MTLTAETVLRAGEFYSGILSSSNDQDFVGVSVVAGQGYTIEVSGAAREFSATLLENLGSGFIVWSVPHGNNGTAWFSFVAEETTTVYVSLSGGPGRTGQYDVSVFAGTGNYPTPGHDNLRGSEGRNRVDLQDGDDIYDGAAGGDVIHGGPGNDTIFAGDNDHFLDLVLAGPGNDQVHGQDGNDYLTGNDGDDVVLGENGDDEVYGGPGNDLLEGGPGDDTLVGESSNDVLDGGTGDDALFGEGTDFLMGGDGQDVLSGETHNFFSDAISAQVVRLYQATLDRAPDPVGHAFWTAELQSNRASLQQVVDGFVHSLEFQSKYGDTTDAAFITLLYENVLDRAPDQEGFSNWEDSLARETFSRSEVVTLFSESEEFRAKTAGDAITYSRAAVQSAWADDVFRLYVAVLDRTPDMVGLQDWTARLANGTEYLFAVAGFTDSPEFLNRYGQTTNSEFVTLLYDNVLGRAPDPTGLAAWTEHLETGSLTRVEVVSNFAQSLEFEAGSQASLEAWMRAQGGDRLDGGQGENVLFGGLGADVFVFSAQGDGTQIIADLEQWDTVELSNSGIANADALIAGLMVDDDDLVLVEGSATLRIMNARAEDLSPDMFLFV